MNNRVLISIITLISMVIIGIIYYTYSNWDNTLIYEISNETSKKTSNETSDETSNKTSDVTSNEISNETNNEIIIATSNETSSDLGGDSRDTSSAVDTKDTSNQSNETNDVPLSSMSNSNSDPVHGLLNEITLITVYMYGAIVKSGIYQIYDGARVYEVLALAGGLEENADLGYVNQARYLVDGESIFFPTKSEAKSLPKQQSAVSSPSNPTQIVNEPTESQLVNINTADKSLLMTLPGVGEAKANSIIEYRKSNGNFTSNEEIMLVNGIKHALFAKIKDLIRIN